MAEFTILVLAIGCILLVWVLWGMDTDFKKLKDENEILRIEFDEHFRKIINSMSYSQRVIYDTYVTLERLRNQIAKAHKLKKDFNSKNAFESADAVNKVITELEKSYLELSTKLDEALAEQK